MIVIVGGCGHVGLPLGLAWARTGRTVVAYDIDAATVQTVNAGHMPFLDRGAEDVLEVTLNAGTFRATTDPEVIAQAEAVVLVTGTPVDRHLNPRIDQILDVITEHLGRLHAGQLLVLRSTVFPGTTQRVRDVLIQTFGEFDVAFCPERVAEGYALEEITSLPQLVAGCTPSAQVRAEALFAGLTPDVIPTTPGEAELAKLFTNTWRYLKFAAANQFFMIANDFGVDFQRVRDAMRTKYPRAADFPSAGFAAGPCLFKDTMQLAAFHNNHFFLGHAAMLVNEGLPNYLVDLAKRTHDLRILRVGILGLTFKPDSDDIRDSLSFKLRRLLETEAREVLCHDPYWSAPWTCELDEVLERAELIFVGVPHTPYRSVAFGNVPVIDPWNMVGRSGDA